MDISTKFLKHICFKKFGKYIRKGISILGSKDELLRIEILHNLPVQMQLSVSLRILAVDIK